MFPSEFWEIFQNASSKQLFQATTSVIAVKHKGKWVATGVDQFLSRRPNFRARSIRSDRDRTRNIAFCSLSPKACHFIKKESLAQVFSCEFWGICKNTFFYRTPPVAASDYYYLEVFLKLLLFFHSTDFFNFSGETAFTNVSQFLGYSKNPLIRRIKNLDKNLPITVLYGKDSWVADLFYFPSLESELFDHCYCSTKIIYDAGHHIYSDNFNDFNRYVNGACNVKVSSRDFTPNVYSLQPIETEQYTLEYSDSIQLVTSIWNIVFVAFFRGFLTRLVWIESY